MYSCPLSTLFRPIILVKPPPNSSLILKNDNNQSQTAVPRRDFLLMMSSIAAVCRPPPGAAAASYPIKLEGVVRRVVGRPRKSRSKKAKEEEEEVLVISGIEFDGSEFVKFDVYVNDHDDGRGGPRVAEFAGSLVNVPHGRGGNMKTCLRLGITDLLDNLGADDDDHILVTLVPNSALGLVTINDIGIEFL